MQIRFVDKEKKDFLKEVKKRVEAYFEEKKLSKNATFGTKVKAVCLLGLLALFWSMLLVEPFPFAGMLVIWAFMGVLVGFIGINISHDALHGSFSANPKMNTLFGYTYDFVGLSSFMWKQTHNGGHHTFTNITGHDPDIDKPYLLRLSPHDEWQPFHRLQNIYIWFLYSLIGLNWIFYSDYVHFSQYRRKMSLSDKFWFFFFKAVNLIVFLIVPLLVMQAPLWQILSGYIFMYLVGGFTVSLIFQLAHLVEGVSFPLPSDEGIIHEHWGVHEMMTTSNFATRNRFLNIVLGGLNFQVEHHLFPNVSHGHYKDISPIVKKTAEEYGVPYHEIGTFREAVASHYRHLTKMGYKQDGRQNSSSVN